MRRVLGLTLAFVALMVISSAYSVWLTFVIPRRELGCQSGSPLHPLSSGKRP